jgi:hypothetical protein
MSSLVPTPGKRARNGNRRRSVKLRRRKRLQLSARIAVSIALLLATVTVAIYRHTRRHRKTEIGQATEQRGADMVPAPVWQIDTTPAHLHAPPKARANEQENSVGSQPSQSRAPAPETPFEAKSNDQSASKLSPPNALETNQLLLSSNASYDRPTMLGLLKYPRQPLGSDELRKQLRAVAEFGLKRDTDDPIVKQIIDMNKRQFNDFPQRHPFASVIADVQTLPLRMGLDCHLNLQAAMTLQSRSKKLREYMFDSRNASDLRRQLTKGDWENWIAPSAVPTLVQILQTEGEDFRLLLVELLSKTSGRAASRALANRAVFDISSDVRHAAVQALRQRDKKEYRDVLIGGLRHPWPTAADFAATALVGVNDRSAFSKLVKLLDEPNPAAPYSVYDENGLGHYMREMVRINHNQNCVLCHALSVNNTEFVRAAIPDPKAPLPPPFSPAYYRQRLEDKSRVFIRADVTYLRQDFSLPQTVESSDPSREIQRFDYCVRNRPLSNDDWIALSERPIAYPQREAVLFALRELSGEDRGRASGDWLRIAARFKD